MTRGIFETFGEKELKRLEEKVRLLEAELAKKEVTFKDVVSVAEKYGKSVLTKVRGTVTETFNTQSAKATEVAIDVSNNVSKKFVDLRSDVSKKFTDLKSVVVSKLNK
jgi:hypothetical protein